MCVCVFGFLLKWVSPTTYFVQWGVRNTGIVPGFIMGLWQLGREEGFLFIIHWKWKCGNRDLFTTTTSLLIIMGIYVHIFYLVYFVWWNLQIFEKCLETELLRRFCFVARVVLIELYNYWCVECIWLANYWKFRCITLSFDKYITIKYRWSQRYCFETDIFCNKNYWCYINTER